TGSWAPACSTLTAVPSPTEAGYSGSRTTRSRKRRPLRRPTRPPPLRPRPRPLCRRGRSTSAKSRRSKSPRLSRRSDDRRGIMSSLLAVYAGSFDPVTLGHLDLIDRCARIFDEVVVAVGRHATKKAFFTFAERVELLREVTKDISNVRIDSFDGLLIHFCE